MKGHTSLKALAIALVALLVLPPLASALAAAETVTLQATAATPVNETANESAVAAQMFIKRIEVFINKTLTIAEENNITIPDNLTTLVNESESLLAQAEQALTTGNITAAVNLAYEAAETFAPVAEYVWSNLPTAEKQSMVQLELMNTIRARIMALERLRAYVAKLNESGVNTRPLVMMLARINQTLEMALRMAEEGNVTAAKAMLAKAEKMLMLGFKEALRNVDRKIHVVAAYSAVLRELGMAYKGLIIKLNATITLIENNQTQKAIAKLYDAERELTRLSTRIEAIYQAVAARYPNSTALQALEILMNATVEAQGYVNESIASLQEGDVNTTIMDVTLAIEVLNSALTQLNETQLPKIIAQHMHKLEKEAEKMREALIRMHERIYAAIAYKIEKIKAHLEYLLAEYQNGTVSQEKLVKEFSHAYRMLERIRNALGDNAPAWLKEKIDQTMQWINQTVPAAGSGAGGHGSGGHSGGEGSSGSGHSGEGGAGEHNHETGKP